MKKLLVIFAMATVLCACNGRTETVVSNDSVVDTVMVDTTATDSVIVDSVQTDSTIEIGPSYKAL